VIWDVPVWVCVVLGVGSHVGGAVGRHELYWFRSRESRALWVWYGGLVGLSGVGVGFGDGDVR